LVSEAALDRGVLAASQEEDLRALADRLLETRRVEYVDEGVLLVMNPPAFEHREIVRLISRSYLLVDQERTSWSLFGLAEGWQRYQVAAEGKYGEVIPLPEPFGFAIETAGWPR
jgi:hypothetical protein